MYKWNAEDYQKNSSQQHKFAKESISQLRLKGNERILDIGCGDGKVTAEIAALIPNGSILGTDKSKDMIDFAQIQFPQPDFPNLSFQEIDASYLHFDNEFDLVVSFSCLHWIIDHIPVLEGIKRSLKSGGRAILHFGGKGCVRTVIDAADKVIAYEKWRKYFQKFSLGYSFYGADEYREWLNRVGLQADCVELTFKDMIHQGKEGLTGWLRTTWMPLTSAIPEELQPEFVEDLANTYIESNPLDSQGLVHVPITRLKVEATKI